MAYENRHSFRDGKIVLYTRNGRPTFHARLSIDGMDGYVVRSTKRTSVEEARRVAEEWYDDYRYKIRHGLETGTHTFATLWKRWLAANRATLSTPRLRYISGTIDRYLMPYFGDMSVSSITDKVVAGYWDWRINYWVSETGQAKIASAQKTRTTAKRPYKQKLGNVAKVPAPKTLKMEQSVLRQIFGWAARSGIVSYPPEVKAPVTKSPGTVSRRPAFDFDEWQQLYRFLRVWAAGEHESGSDGGRSPKRSAHSLHLWQRQLLRNYVLIMGMTGLRPNEARQLRWKDVQVIQNGNDHTFVALHVSPTTKTGERLCIPLARCRDVLERVRAASTHTQPDDFVFCGRDGTPIENFGKTFKSVLTEAGLLKDRFGRVRTIYSLRHTYATLRILHGSVSIDDLAQNMGTSPAIIFQHYRHITTRQRAKELGGVLNTEMSRKGLYF
ncbi:hypothetical protein GCM10017083_15670 [Thalassobaculum fulvum]|uniref:Tyr recombinase domain-containing protein n=1 Tax=Thalassobaculum fulvum TaxID=1633335 RepID=A0A918XQ44_9PROT|nr:tyrosine-type recombinase/integrase [Thalassobaculum fulvum]GHD46498.1 hypothetical protein GCM10017083_15670 [Thalassobaculum fulvum]